MPGKVEKKPVDLSTFAQTISDMYSGAKIEDILDAGWIVDSKGYPVANTGNTEKNIQKIYDLVDKQKENSKIYFQGIQNKWKGMSDDTVTLEYNKDGNLEPKVSDKHIININVKSATLLELANVNEGLQKYKGKNPDIVELRNNCEKLITDLTMTSDQKDFNQKLNTFASAAERYYASHAPASLNKTQAKNANLAYDILKIRNDAKDNKEPKKTDKIEEMQARIAAKYVSAYCLHTIDKSPLEKSVKQAQEILSNAKLFNEKVEKTLKDPSFLFMYGSRKEGDEKDLLSRLNEGLSSKAAKVFNNVEKERRFPSQERLEINAILKESQPKRYNPKKQYESMSLQDQKPITETVKSLREELDAIGGSGTSSPEFEKLKHELLVADIRLQRQSPFMDVKAEMAQLGDAVDEYVNKKMQEGKINSRGLKRLNVAMRLKNLCDGVEKNKKPDEVLKSREETSKEILAQRLSMHLAKEMTKTDDPMIAKEGATILRNKKAMAEAQKQMLNSQTFKEMFNNPSKLQDALESKPGDIYKDILKQEFKKADPKEIKKAQIKKEKTQEIKTKNTLNIKNNKEKEKDSVMIEMQNI